MLHIGRNTICDNEWELIKVDDFSIFKSFSCGDEDIDEFVRYDAELHKKELLAETYMLQNLTVKDILPIAFCSLCNDAIQLSTHKKKKIFPEKKRYQYQPAVKIARMGVRSEFQGNNIGSYVINMVKRLFIVDNRTGCRFITVDAYNKPNILKFYKRNDFQFLHEKDSDRHTRIMFFDLKRLDISASE